jgi:hypothetical protein
MWLRSLYTRICEQAREQRLFARGAVDKYYLAFLGERSLCFRLQLRKKSQKEHQMPLPSVVSQALTATAVAVVAVIAGGIGGFLSHAYFEIWFQSVDDLQVTNPASWPKIANAFSASFDVTKPLLYRGYYGENVRDLATTLSTADFGLKYFGISGRVVGWKKKGDVTFSITGQYNTDHLVLTQRGPNGGVGTFVLKVTQDLSSHTFYYGYFITEDINIPGGSELWLTQCPIVMVREDVANQLYPNVDAAKNGFAFLRTKCIEFKLPSSVDVDVMNN